MTLQGAGSAYWDEMGSGAHQDSSFSTNGRVVMHVRPEQVRTPQWTRGVKSSRAELRISGELQRQVVHFCGFVALSGSSHFVESIKVWLAFMQSVKIAAFASVKEPSLFHGHVTHGEELPLQSEVTAQMDSSVFTQQVGCSEMRSSVCR